MRSLLPSLAVVLAFLIAVVIVLYVTPKRPVSKSREQLRKEYEEAKRHHERRAHIHKLFVQATCEQLDDETTRASRFRRSLQYLSVGKRETLC